MVEDDPLGLDGSEEHPVVGTTTASGAGRRCWPILLAQTRPRAFGLHGTHAATRSPATALTPSSVDSILGVLSIEVVYETTAAAGLGPKESLLDRATQERLVRPGIPLQHRIGCLAGGAVVGLRHHPLHVALLGGREGLVALQTEQLGDGSPVCPMGWKDE